MILLFFKLVTLFKSNNNFRFLRTNLYFQSVLESLPGVDPQSDAVRQAVGAMSGSSEKKDDKGKKEDKSKK